MLEDLGLIGNCQFSALIDAFGAVRWCCLPRFDSEPVFGSLLDPEGGDLTIAPAGGGRGVQRYLPSSNVLETRFDAPDGSFRVIDFAPRFLAGSHGRYFRPTQLHRIIEPISGAPMVRVACRPICGWSKRAARLTNVGDHIEVDGLGTVARVTTDVVPADVVSGTPFPLRARAHVVFSWGDQPETPTPEVTDRYLRETLYYWSLWVKRCNVPATYQREVIRSALALKLHCFEETGAIVASMTTSLPEVAGSGRTWDYRYCWLRDAYYTLSAFRSIGHFEERENFLKFLVGVTGARSELALDPLYRIDGSTNLTESTLDHWAGYEGGRPIRVGNAAAPQLQHDVYGEMILALAPVFLDERYESERTPETLALMRRLAQRAIEVAGTPDAGIWEYRNEWVPQTFSSLMCWAAVDRMATICANGSEHDKLARAARAIRDQILAKSWNAERGYFAATYGGAELDASLLQMSNVRFLAYDDPRLLATVEAIERGLTADGWVRRYHSDFIGQTEVAFTICTFWLVEALAHGGRVRHARELLDRVRAMRAPLGLMSEDYDPKTQRMWGNFPQAYSHVGMIQAAFAASPAWYEVA
jgi:GH15 family glucan-1,4-alpha-glucosidase